jgi:hypothetical protein
MIVYATSTSSIKWSVCCLLGEMPIMKSRRTMSVPNWLGSGCPANLSCGMFMRQFETACLILARPEHDHVVPVQDRAKRSSYINAFTAVRPT